MCRCVGAHANKKIASLELPDVDNKHWFLSSPHLQLEMIEIKYRFNLHQGN